MKKICLDPGHGGSQSGAVFKGLNEKDVTLAVVKEVKSRLLLGSYEVILTRSDDITVSLSNRCKIANEAKTDIFVSIHCNADPDEDLPGMPEAKGEEIWYFKKSSRGKRLAEALASWVDRMFPAEPFRGIKSTEIFYVLKHTIMPAVLIEVGFIDNSSTRESFANELTIKDIGIFIAEGINEYFESN